ncbi:hypothetical protein AHMF7605_23340 [Adhaeribacter arboris]|uniref:HEAT repeat domain-containing protein n=1 Tax=Adhaeribacter arboris TaxID=2072846 RepID=A0A2T2YL45_9BACT|nr:hypothetical protein [Adhaeribacter arboris]PSR56227.1 hypothetical protein AHMF7605_23340 [Adhaeribacter arboris]
MHPLLIQLTNPGQKYAERAKHLLEEVGDNPDKFAIFLNAMLDPSTPANTAQYAADLSEKISQRHPHLLLPHQDTLITALPRTHKPIIRWHLALILSYLPLLSDDPLAEVIDYVQNWLRTDPNKFLKVHCLQALANLAKKHNWLRQETILLVQEEMAKGGAAINAKGRVLLLQLASSK